MELFLVSADYIDFEKPIKVLKWEKFNVLGRECLLVDLEKELDYSEYGVNNPVSRFILVDRFFKNRLHKLEEFPIEVHVLIPKDKNYPLDGFDNWEQLFNAAWANIYNSYETAITN